MKNSIDDATKTSYAEVEHGTLKSEEEIQTLITKFKEEPSEFYCEATNEPCRNAFIKNKRNDRTILKELSHAKRRKHKRL